MSSLNPLTEVVAEGSACTVECVVRTSGDAPAREFLEELEGLTEKGKDRPDSSACARFMVLFQQMANYGHVSSKRFSKEMGDLYAFKHEVRNRQIRFPCFQDGSKWILTHGFFKPGARKKLGQWPAAEIKRAQEMREYFARKTPKSAKEKP
jgi:hypothetical protein